MMYKNIREEELKNKVGSDWFSQFDTTEKGKVGKTKIKKYEHIYQRQII